MTEYRCLRGFTRFVLAVPLVCAAVGTVALLAMPVVVWVVFQSSGVFAMNDSMVLLRDKNVIMELATIVACGVALLWSSMLVFRYLIKWFFSIVYRFDSSGLECGRGRTTWRVDFTDITEVRCSLLRGLALKTPDRAFTVSLNLESAVELATRLREAVVGAGGRFGDDVHRKAVRVAGCNAWQAANTSALGVSCLLVTAVSGAVAVVMDVLIGIHAAGLQSVILQSVFVASIYAASLVWFSHMRFARYGEPGWVAPGRASAWKIHFLAAGIALVIQAVIVSAVALVLL